MTSSFRGRLRLARLPDGWMVLDLESGRYFRANVAGARIAASLSRGAPLEDVAARLSAQLGASPATSAIAGFVAALERPAAPLAANPVRFVEAADVVQMRVAERHVVDLSRDGRSMVVRDLAAEPRRVADWIRLALPHALTLQGLTVLHASAIRDEAGVHAFSGASGAGKSTWAGALLGSGADRVADDLVVLTPERPRALAALGAEQVLRTWAEEHAHSRGSTLTPPSREAFAAWPRTAPLRRVSFLAGRHADPDVRAQRLAPSETCAQLLANSFAETGLARVLAERLRAAAWLSRHVVGDVIVVPEGLERLSAAASSYRAMIDS